MVPTRCTRGVVRRPLPRGDQTEEGEALRDDDDFAYVAAWEYTGEGNDPCSTGTARVRDVHLAQRSYK